MLRNLQDVLPDNVRRAVEAIEWEPQSIDPTFECAGCYDRGVIRYDVPFGHEYFGKLYPCPDCEQGRALLERKWKARLSQTELPSEYQNLSFDSWNRLPEEKRRGKGLAVACAKLFVQSDNHMVSLAAAFAMCGRQFEGDPTLARNSLILQGEPGLGKTGLAAAILNEFTAQGKSILYIRTQDFVESVKHTFNNADRRAGDPLPTSTVEMVDLVKRAPRLIMDEFNMTKVTDWRQEIIENVIRYRYGNKLPTILTCNAEPGELERQWGERTTSVLFTMAHWIPMGGLVLRNTEQVTEVF